MKCRVGCLDEESAHLRIPLACDPTADIVISRASQRWPLARYIHLNPVRAGIVESPEDYPWSSYPSYVGRRKPCHSWLTTDCLLSLFADSRPRAVAALRSFTESESEDGAEREELLNARAEGSVGGFLDADPEGDRVADRAVTINEILDAVNSVSKLPRRDLNLDTQRRDVVGARALAAWLVSRTPHLTLEGLARIVGRDASTLSRAAGTITSNQSIDPSLREICRKLEEHLDLKRS